MKSTFLNGNLKEEVYVDQSLGFGVKGLEYKGYKLKNTLYGIKQAWYSWIDLYLVNSRFNGSNNEGTLYTKPHQEKFLQFLFMLMTRYIEGN